MEIKQVLIKILEFGKREGFFDFFRIGDIHKSCCKKANTIVIDFDKTQIRHAAAFNYQTLKSCDCLKIVPEEGRIDFIEMKGFRQYIKRDVDINGPIAYQASQKLETFDLLSKIRDSITILNNIVQSNKLSLTGKERRAYHKAIKNYILLVDIDIENNPLDFILTSFEFLSHASTSIEKRIAMSIKKEIRSLNLSDYDNLQQPILKNCHSIDELYYTEQINVYE